MAWEFLDDNGVVALCVSLFKRSTDLSIYHFFEDVHCQVLKFSNFPVFKHLDYQIFQLPNIRTFEYPYADTWKCSSSPVSNFRIFTLQVSTPKLRDLICWNFLPPNFPRAITAITRRSQAPYPVSVTTKSIILRRPCRLAERFRSERRAL